MWDIYLHFNDLCDFYSCIGSGTISYTKESSVIKILDLDLLTKMAEHEIDEGGQVQN